VQVPIAGYYMRFAAVCQTNEIAAAIYLKKYLQNHGEKGALKNITLSLRFHCTGKKMRRKLFIYFFA